MYQLLRVGTERSIYSTYRSVKCAGMGLYTLLFDADDVGGGTASDPPTGAKGGGDGTVDGPPAGGGGRGGGGGGDGSKEDGGGHTTTLALSRTGNAGVGVGGGGTSRTFAQAGRQVVAQGCGGDLHDGRQRPRGTEDLCSGEGRRAEGGGGVKERADDGVVLMATREPCRQCESEEGEGVGVGVEPRSHGGHVGSGQGGRRSQQEGKGRGWWWAKRMLADVTLQCPSQPMTCMTTA
ncbi:hypothetical protein B0H14DRAFT_2647891 [Mycena olivaceomarginata]|nr:hypothetical protein B0H14DRAFT_2647891 [Mycena olivaceomarginata]